MNDTLCSGTLLLASPLLLDPNFHQAAVLVISHNENGSFGLVLNRPCGLTLGRSLGGACPEPLQERTLFAGGPVEPRSFFCLHNNRNEFINCEIVVPGVFFGAEAEVLDAYAFDTPHPDFQTRFFAGYTGWGADQLDQEIQEGSWIVRRACRADIFEAVDALWQRHLESGASRGDPSRN